MAEQQHQGIRSEWRSHGRIIVPCFAGNLLCTIHAYSLGPMITPIESEFGWSRATISGGLLIISLMAIIFAPLVGMAIDRYGPRRIAVPGVVFYCIAIALFATTNNDPVNWWMLWALLALANMCIAPMVWTAAINARFDRNRGMALALALSGTSVGGAIVPLVTTALIAGQGWRGAYVALALIGLLIVLPLVVLLFRDPKPPGQEIDPPVHARDTTRWAEVRGIIAAPRFLTLAGAVGLFTLAICAFTTNGVPLLLGEGFDSITAAGIVGAAGVGSLMGRLMGGYLLDRFTARTVAAIAVALPAVSSALLLGTDASQPVAYGAFLLLGLAAGAEYDACAYLAARHFGMRHFGALFGVITALIFISNGVAPAGANLVFDLTGSYELVLYASIGLFLASSVLFLATGSYPDEPLNVVRSEP